MTHISCIRLKLSVSHRVLKSVGKYMGTICIQDFILATVRLLMRSQRNLALNVNNCFTLCADPNATAL